MALNLRGKVVSALQGKDYKRLIELWSQDTRVIRNLISLTYDKKEVIAWRAMEAIGLITRVMSERRPEDVRNLAGRLLWMMRDESGGIGWSAPEILGEIIRNNPELCTDLASVLISFHEESMLRSGVLWAIGRIAEVRRELVLSARPIVISCLNDSRPSVCGMAVWSLGKLDPNGYNDKLKDLISDERIMIIYDKGELRRTTIGDLARSATGEETRGEKR